MSNSSLAGRTILKMVDVAMSSIVGEYDDPDQVPEWQWVKSMASHEHLGVKDNSAYEYTLNVSIDNIDDAPQSLRALISDAEQEGINYILFYHE